MTYLKYFAKMVDVFLFGIFTVLAIFWILRKNGRKGRRIPGPKGLPLVGCVLEVKEENIHTKFSDYAYEYGNIFQFKLMNDTIIGLNSEHLIRLAYAQDGYKEYLNDKPATFYAEMLLYGSQSTEFCKDGYSAEHTAYRKGFTNVMKVYGAGSDSTIEEMFMTEIKRGLMKRIEGYNGRDFEIAYELKRSLANTLSCLFRGEPFDDNDPNASIFDDFSDCVDYFSNASVNNVLTTLPFLRYMPGPYGKQFAKALKTRETIINIFFKEQKESHVPGVIRGVVDKFLEEQRKDREAGQEPFYTDERIICQILEIAANALLTTRSIMPSTFLCLLHHPEYQDKMFEELDAVAGRDRDLCINDKAKCPLYEAVELETHRYIPVVPILGPRLCGVNLEFEGYDLPKGSMVFANFWHIFHNEKIWGDPWNFRPERWLDEQGNLLPRDHVYRKNWLPFGYGRRQCIGEQFGRFRIFMYLASLLRRWKFVAPPGKMMSCDPRDQSSFCYEVTMRPKPFYCHVQERY